VELETLLQQKNVENAKATTLDGKRKKKLVRCKRFFHAFFSIKMML